ncbi:hypothetical protein PU560_04850, partial [Georgenia sp. 10Sc9-8]|nr:hypothetical protein [Georgenia halotolerans]
MTDALSWLTPRPVSLGHPAPAGLDPGVQVLMLPGGALSLGADPTGPGEAAARAAACAPHVPADAVLCRGSAVWVHTGRLRPAHVEAAHPAGRRLPGGSRRCRSATLDDADVVILHGVRVTSPVRTGADLARFWPVGRAADGLIALREAGLDLVAVTALLAGYG